MADHRNLEVMRSNEHHDWHTEIMRTLDKIHASKRHVNLGQLSQNLMEQSSNR